MPRSSRAHPELPTLPEGSPGEQPGVGGLGGGSRVWCEGVNRNGLGAEERAFLEGQNRFVQRPSGHATFKF